MLGNLLILVDNLQWPYATTISAGIPAQSTHTISCTCGQIFEIEAAQEAGSSFHVVQNVENNGEYNIQASLAEDAKKQVHRALIVKWHCRIQ